MTFLAVLLLLMLAPMACGDFESFYFYPDTRSGIEFLAPPADALVAGPFDVQVKYDLGLGNEAVLAELYVDEERYFARPVLDGKPAGECVFTVQSTDFADGGYVLTAVVHDAKAEKHYAVRRVRVDNTGVGVRGETEPPRVKDMVPPNVEIVRPIFGQTVWGKFDVLVAASDESGNPMVSIYVDGRNVLTSNSPPYRWMWDTRLADNGLHEVGAVAYDRAMNKAEANPVAVTVANEKLTTGPEDLLAAQTAVRIAPVITQIQSAVHGPLLGVIGQEQTGHRSPRISPQAAETPQVRLELEIPLDEELPAREAVGDSPESIVAQGLEGSVTPLEPNWVVARREAVQAILSQQAPTAPQLAVAPQAPVGEAEAETADIEIGSGPAAPEMLGGTPMASEPQLACVLKEVEPERAPVVAATGHQARTEPASPPSESRPIRAAKPEVATLVPKPERVESQISRPAAAKPSVPAEEIEPTQVATAQIAPVVQAISPVPKLAVYLDSRLISFDVDPLIENGYTITPIRHVIEKLGGSVMWYSNTKTVTANCRAKALRLKIGEREALVDSEPAEIPLAPYIAEGRTMVPLRFLGNVLGLSLEYDRASGIVYASTAEAGSQ